MADVYSVQNTLVGLIAGIVYPHGTSNASIGGSDTYIYAGWPQPARLESDLKANKCHISVYPLPTEVKKDEPLGRPWQLMTHGVPTITYTVSGQQITFSGTVSTPININVYAANQHHVYAVQSTDTLTTIASALATLIGHGATSSGAVLTMPVTELFSVRIGTADTVGRLLKRQEKDYQITVWTSTPSLRAVVAPAVENGLAALTTLSMSDGSPTTLRYKRSIPSDQEQSYLVYRHDMIFSVDFCSMQTAQATQVVAPTMNVKDMSGNSIKSFPE